MKFFRYKYTYLALVLFAAVLFFIPVFLQLNLKQVKEQQYFKKSKVSREIFKETEKEDNVSLHTIIEVLDKKTYISMEEINLKENYKEVILSFNKEIDEVKEELKELMELEIIKDIVEIDYNKNLWYITIIFN